MFEDIFVNREIEKSVALTMICNENNSPEHLQQCFCHVLDERLTIQLEQGFVSTHA